MWDLPDNLIRRSCQKDLLGTRSPTLWERPTSARVSAETFLRDRKLALHLVANVFGERVRRGTYVMLRILSSCDDGTHVKLPDEAPTAAAITVVEGNSTYSLQSLRTDPSTLPRVAVEGQAQP